MKRYRPQAVQHRRPPQSTLPTLFGQPEKDFYRLPELTIRGGCLLTDGCRRVLDFSPERLCLDMGRTVITLYGTDLRIESFVGRRLSVAGQISRMEFAWKWRKHASE